MKLSDLAPAFGSTQVAKRKGRGAGTGNGKTAGKGHKGQNARAGGGVRPGFEGGQMPLQRRLPKHGFKNYPFKVTYDVINLDSLLAHFPGKDTITLEDIYTRGLASPKMPVKILARGEVTSAISVEAHKFSAKAAEKIVQAGGKVTALEKNEAEAPAAAAE